MPARPHDPARRRLLLGLAATGLLAACGRSEEPHAAPTPPGTGTPGTGTPTTTPSPAPTRPAPPPPPAPYVPVAGEVFAEAKTLAADVAVALATYGAADDPDAVAARAADGRGAVDTAALRTAAAPLFVAGATSRATVDYPQLGGLAPLPEAGRPRAASVMVVLRQVLEVQDEPVRTVVRTLDVRLRDDGAGWRLQSLEDAGGSPVPRPPRVSPAAAAVLDDPRIVLPDSARWDIHRGEADPSLAVDDRLLAEMARLAQEFAYRVTCLRTGHPRYVFDGDPTRGQRTSNHYAGRAVDIWSVGDRPVVQQRGDTASAAFRLVERAAGGAGLAELGAPAASGTPAAGRWDLDGRPGSNPTFTNGVHDDHVHLGYGGRR